MRSASIVSEGELKASATRVFAQGRRALYVGVRRHALLEARIAACIAKRPDRAIG
jgi:hypothetical protein